MKKGYLTEWSVVREMALMGYSVTIISLQTGVDSQRCRGFFNILARHGYYFQHKKRLRSSFMFIRNREEKIQTSLLMLIYIGLLNLNGDAVHQPIKLPILQKAFELYREIKKSIQNYPWMDLDINDAWSMAQELRNNDAYIRCCRVCAMPYFTSIYQRTTVDCPFCVP